jgi:hypothetical protein
MSEQRQRGCRRRTQDPALTPWHTPPGSCTTPANKIVRILDGWPAAHDLLDAYQRIALIT